MNHISSYISKSFSSSSKGFGGKSCYWFFGGTDRTSAGTYHNKV
jgi:hypothetical protein